MRIEQHSIGYNLRKRFPNMCCVFPGIGGSVWKAEQSGKYYILIPEGTSSETAVKSILKILLEYKMPDEKWYALRQSLYDALRPVRVIEFNSENEREIYVAEWWPDLDLECKKDFLTNR